MQDIIFQLIEWDQYHEAPINGTDNDDNSNSENDTNGTNDTENLENELNGENKKPKFEDLEYKIRLYGRTQEGKSIHVRVDGYTPFFYVEVPRDWGQIKVMTLINYIKGRINKEYVSKGLLRFEVIERKKYYGFTAYQNFKFIRLVFKNMMSYKTFEKWIENNKISSPNLFKVPTKLQLYESNIEPFIRCMHIRKLNACGWVKINKYKIMDTVSFCDEDISVNWKDLNPYANSSMQKFVVASFDIECMSESGNFPQATNDKDQIIQIGTVFSYYGESEPFFKHMITLGGCEKIESLSDVVIESYKTERNVLLAWTKLIQKMNPDIITGYNINGFDFDYMHSRAQKIEQMTKVPLVDSFLKLSRIIGETSQFKIKELCSAGLGDNLLKYIAMGGRIIIDLMKVVQRDHKLDSYKLDNVAANFIKEPIKTHLTDKNNTTILGTTSTYGIKKDQYLSIMFNDGLTDNKHDEKYKIIDINDKEKKIIINGTIPEEIFEASNKVYWCHAKDDVSPNEMFKMFKGSDKDRAIIAKYCIQDCVLVTKLMEKLQILNANIGMANVCSVPLSYIFMRGQGAKIFSLVAQKCRDLEHLVPKITPKNNNSKNNNKNNSNNKNSNPDIPGIDTVWHKIKKNDDVFAEEEEEEGVGYEGATVFPPVKGVHYEPIPVLDYASLYPRSMICINISHECIVLDSKYDNLPDFNYKTVTYKNNDGTTTTCRFAKKKDGTTGILCLILIELLEKRSATKKLMEQTEDKFLKNIYDGLQLAYKVTANGLYGLLGASTSPIYMKELAASTTATGREMLEFSRDFIEGPFGDLINLAMSDEQAFYIEADKLFTYQNDKLKKVYPSVYTFTPDKKFNEPRAGRHTKKDFIDYFYKKVKSVLNDTQRVKPQIIYGDSVVGDTPILLLNSANEVEIKFIKDIGNCWKEYSQFKSGDLGLTNKEQDDLINYKVWTDKGWGQIKRIIRHNTNKKIYGISTGNGYVKVTEDHSLLDSSSNQIKPSNCKIGMGLLHNDKFEVDCEQIYYENLLEKYSQECNSYVKNNGNYIKTSNKLKAMHIYYLAKQCGYNVEIFVEFDDSDIEIFTIRYDFSQKSNYKIVSIRDLGYLNNFDYVYDLETDVGHFHAGIGSMIVKNTDSVFFTMKIHDITSMDIKTDKEALGMCIELGQLAGATICKILPEPEEQVYEKTLWPLVLISKKRYVGNLYETDVNKYYQKSMGIVLKRRDNAKIVKIVVGGIVNYILNERSNKGAVDYTRALIKKILRGYYDIDKYIITKTLKGGYKDRTRIVHAVLADRIAKRDPGNKPELNDRVPYVYIIPKGKVTLQGERVEDPKYVLENNLELDYLFYLTNQIMKPSIQFLELIAVNPEKLFQNYINKEINRRKNIASIYDYVKLDETEKNNNQTNNDQTNNDNTDQMIVHIPASKKQNKNSNLNTGKKTNIDLDLELEQEFSNLNKNVPTNKNTPDNKKSFINKITAQQLDEELEEKFTFNPIPKSKQKITKTKNVTKNKPLDKEIKKPSSKPSLTIEL
jgi:DNA polymerase elongation subunit (family B)